MALIRGSNLPSAWSGSWLSDFFDDESFLDSKLMKRSMPAVNVRESDKNYEIEVAAPGYSKEDFKITLDNGLLTVSAERREEKKEANEKNYTRREFGYSSFSRSFNLPVNVNDEDIDARYQDGILTLAIAKKSLPNAKEKKAIDIK
jgi:HSP20 family protein